MKSSWWTASWPRRAASSAASLTRFRRSAPTSPGVDAATSLRSTSAASGMPRVWTLQDRLAPDLVRRLDGDAAVEAAGPQQRLVQHVRAVGGRQHDDPLARAEAVHLGQDLIQRLLLLAVAAAVDHPAPRAADGVQLVDEDDGRGGLAGLLEQVAHAAGAHADDHLDELAGAHAEERHPGLAGDRLGEQRLARPGRADQQHALGRGPAQPGVLLRVLQEVDDLDQLRLGLVDPGHVGEGDLVVAGGRLVVALRLALAQAEQAAAGAGRRRAW